MKVQIKKTEEGFEIELNEEEVLSFFDKLLKKVFEEEQKRAEEMKANAEETIQDMLNRILGGRI